MKADKSGGRINKDSFTEFDKNINKSSSFFGLLADPNRLKVFSILVYGETTVTQIYECLELRQNLISHHLKILKDGGIAKSRRKGRKVYYSIKPEVLKMYENLFMKISKPLQGEKKRKL